MFGDHATPNTRRPARKDPSEIYRWHIYAAQGVGWGGVAVLVSVVSGSLRANPFS